MEARCFVFFFFFLEKFSIIADRFSIVFALLLEDVDIKEGWKIRDNMLQRKSSIRRKCYDTCSNLITR